MIPPGKFDYGKASLILGGLSIVGGVGYWFWQFSRAEQEARYQLKYREAKRAIAEVQAVFGLQPTGKLDPPTRSLLSRLATEGYEIRT